MTKSDIYITHCPLPHPKQIGLDHLFFLKSENDIIFLFPRSVVFCMQMNPEVSVTTMGTRSTVVKCLILSARRVLEGTTVLDLHHATTVEIDESLPWVNNYKFSF